MKEQEINRYWKRIVNTMNDGLILISPDGTIVMINQAFEQQTGYSADEVIGKPCTMLKCDSCEKTMRSDEKALVCSFCPRSRGYKALSLYDNEKRWHLVAGGEECLGVTG